MSPFAYNEGGAQEYYPLTREQAQERGYAWREQKHSHTSATMLADAIPDESSKIPETILNETIECFHRGQCADRCSSMFRLTRSELEFYKTMNLPLPNLCPNCRHYARVTKRNPHPLSQRTCGCGGERSRNGDYTNIATHAHGVAPCSREFETTYTPDRPDIVYCTECYQQEVV